MSKSNRTSNRPGLTRRNLLRGLGAAAVSAPLLNAPLRADDTPQKRLVVFFSPQGQHVTGWRPGDAGDPSSSRVLEPLAGFRDRMITLEGLRGSEGSYGHPWGPRAALTGTPDASQTSLDQVIGQRLRGVTPLSTLELGVLSGDRPSGRVSYAGPGLAAPAVHDPASAFDRIARFSGGDESARALSRMRRGDVVELASRELALLHGRVGARRGHLLEAHRSYADDLARQIREPVPVAMCDLPERLSPDDDDHVAHTEAMLGLAATALTCDITRVVTVVMDKGESRRSFPFLGFDHNWHDIAHGQAPDATNKLHIINTYLAQHIANFCERLDATIESDGSTMLDNTVVMWINELNLMTWEGHDGNHRRANMPCVVIGGGMNGGQYLDCGDRPYGDFLMTIGHQMGATDLTSFGAEGTSVIEEILA